MAEEYSKSHECETGEVDVEAKDRGLFGFLGKKEEEKPCDKGQEAVMVSEFEKVKVSEGDEPKWERKEEYKEEEKEERKEKEEEKKKESLLEKLHRADSSSSSSSDEEEREGEEKKKKKKEKKGRKEKIAAEKEKEEEKKEEYEAATIPVEKCEEVEVESGETVQPEGKKGFLEKIKEKLPGQKKTEEPSPALSPPPVEYVAAETVTCEGEPKEKKGILDKIKEKLPGYHSKSEEVKEKEQYV